MKRFSSIFTAVFVLMLTAIVASFSTSKIECILAAGYVREDNRIFADYGKVELDILDHYPHPKDLINVISYEGLIEDVEQMREMNSQFKKVTPPGILSDYHTSKVDFMDAYANAIESLLSGDKDAALKYLEETDVHEARMVGGMENYTNQCR